MQRILFIDDDEMALQLMSKAVTLLGYQAILSSSPEQGLLLAKKEHPALIMVDMQMDEMDGREFVRQLRRLPPIAHLPVIMFSAGISYTDKAEALKAGADGFLQKPVGLEQLSQTIQSYTHTLPV
jgi:two-component system cell cycle response regulator DivK